MGQVKEFIVYSATKAEFEAQVTSGEVDNTQIGVIAETGEFWEKGNYHPLVDLEDYLKKTDAVELAKDLTGSLEATPEEFVFRASAGTKSIRDESAVIRRIKGNTSVWGQIADINASFTNSGNRYIITRNDDGSVTIKRDPTITEGFWCSLNMDKAYRNTSHKYMFYADVSVSGVAASTDYCAVSVYNLATMVGNHPNFRSNGRHTFCCFGAPNNTSTTWQFAFYAYGASELTIHNLQCFDLTAIFGAGNEPTTLAKFKEVYPESYYPYCEPEVRSMRATGIETIGTNAFNKDDVVGGRIQADGSIVANDVYSIGTIEVSPNQSYYLKDVANGAYTVYSYALYDSNGKHLSIGAFTNTTTKPSNMSGRVTIPMNARFMKVCVYNDYLDSCCVHLVHTGIQNGTYAPFEKNVRMLPDIATYFPDGMHGIGEVYDEINEENAVKRFGVVDLGTLTWNAVDTNGSAKRFDTSGVRNIIKAVSANNIIGNIICSKYDRGTADSTNLQSQCISVDRLGRIYIYDPNYNTADSLSDFVASLQGVMLVYELAEPITTIVTEPLQLDYKVADFGTEKMLHNLPSSPFRADIVYQFNAADRIRDNGRNIERIENSMATMEDVENYMMQNMPTEAAPATQVVAYNVTDGSVAIGPNIMYECQHGIGAMGTFVFPPLYSITGDYEKVWMMRLPSISSSNSLSISHTVKWNDGVAPTFSEAVCLEIYLKKIGTDEYIGEWKIYK